MEVVGEVCEVGSIDANTVIPAHTCMGVTGEYSAVVSDHEIKLFFIGFPYHFFGGGVPFGCAKSVSSNDRSWAAANFMNGDLVDCFSFMIGS